MKFENIRVMNFENALRGMRNPKESYHLIDSAFGLEDMEWCEKDYDITEKWLEYLGIDLADPKARDEAFTEVNTWLINNGVLYQQDDLFEYAFIGPKDMKLAQQLIRGGSEHRKFLRQIMVSVDITAPLYWWKEFDTYKVGTTANSTSTMHKLDSKPITIDLFEIDDYVGKELCINHPIHEDVDSFIQFLETLRLMYLKTRDIRYWKELVRWLPESWLQTRTVTMSYENLLSICMQRRHHKLNEWTGDRIPVEYSFLQFARKLPYAQELLFLDEYTEGTTLPVVDFKQK